MKKLLLILLCLPFIGFRQTEYIPPEYYKNGQLIFEGNQEKAEELNFVEEALSYEELDVFE